MNIQKEEKMRPHKVRIIVPPNRVENPKPKRKPKYPQKWED